MLRLHRHRHRDQSKSEQQVDFKLHGFKALQVPKGWDKLVVSVVSMKTGKTVAKTGKAGAHSGTCVWSDTLSESIRFSDEIEDCLSKLVVSAGSVRSGILGEATVNMTDYMSTNESVPVSLSLKKCTHGTTLQVKIQCLTPRMKSMDEDSKERISDLEKPNGNGNHQDIDMKSEGSGSDSVVAKSLTSSSANDFRLNSNPGELGSRDTSFSLSESHQSYDSAEGSTGGEDMSIGDHSSDVQSLVRKADSLGSENSESPGIHRTEMFHLKQTSLNAQSSENSAKAFREASDGTVEELRAEAKMWERNARKLMLDLDELKAEFSDHSKIRESLSVELSAACSERDDLRREMEQLRQTSLDFRNDDLRFERESNADLAMQLKRSHESNVELVSVLQDLEETVERQKVEMEELLEMQSKFVYVEKSAAENGEENRRLRAQLQEMSVKVKLLEQVLEEKNQQIEMGMNLNSQAFCDVETDYKSRLVEKDGEIAKLKAKILDNGGDGDLIREVEELKAKIQELERDCTELTEENLDLLFKLKEEKSEFMGMSTSVDFPTRMSFEFQLSEQNLATSYTEENLEKNENVLSVELEAKLTEMDRELTERRTGMEKKEEEIAVLRRCQSELEAKVSELQKEKAQIQEHLEVVLQESDISSKCLNDLQNDLAVLTSSVDSHSLANKLLERKSSELKTGYQELERENEQLSNLVVSLEAQLRDLTGQLESSQLELENSKSRGVNLSDEIDRLRDEMRSTVESLIEENDSIHRSNEELRSKKLELHDRCSLLETKLEESRKGFADCSKKVGDLEQYLASVLAEFEAKEKSLSLEIEALLEENLRHKDKFNEEERLLNQMYMEKVVEAQRLQQEVEHLIKKLSKAHEEKERIAFDSIEELTRLQAENERLKADFEENQVKIKQIEMEYEVKLKKLSTELTDSNQGIENLSQLLDNYKSSESKFKTTISDLELKLTVSEYQRQQKSEECSYLNAELKKLSQLEAELGETKLEKEKLEAFLRSMSEECKDLKAEKTEQIENISALKALVSELEDDNSEKLALQEKALQMEDELVEIEVLRVRDTELQKELSQIRKENKQYQQKIEQLQALEEEKPNSREQNGNRKASNFSKAAKNPKNEMAKNPNRRRENGKNQSQKENGGGCECLDGSPHSNNCDTSSKIQLLEDQLAKAFEEISIYKAQLNKVSTEGRKGHTDSPRKSPQEALVSKAKYERTKSSLEAELRDIRERYSAMSLKYAEVEAQREELVMKLKTTAKAPKRWFS